MIFYKNIFKIIILYNTNNIIYLIMEEIIEEKNLKRTDLKPIEFNFIGNSDDLVKKFFF